MIASEMTVLNRLARNPAGDTLRNVTPEMRARLERDRLIFRPVGLRRYRLTRRGWYALDPVRQGRIWTDAAREHGMRQGPADAAEVRRLINEYQLTADAAARLRRNRQNATAAAVRQEADLILVRLAVLVMVPFADGLDEIRVLAMARKLAHLLDAQSRAIPGHRAVADPRSWAERAGRPAPPVLDPWRASPVRVAVALLES